MIAFLILSALAGCSQQESAPVEEPVEPTPEESAPAEEPTEPAPEEEQPTTAVTIIPQDPLGFNGRVADTGYEAMVGEFALLAISEIDPDGNVYPELAVEIPTLENGWLVFDEENWTMDVT